jgi:hypothetical protein
LPHAECCRYRGAALALRELYRPAIEEYSQAVELEPGRCQWRYELALLLKQEGQIAAAHRHAVVCARLQPGNPEYQALLREINRLSM